MAKKHMRVYIEAKDYATIQNISKWLDQNLDKTNFDTNNEMNEGKVIIHNIDEFILCPTISLFMNVTENFDRTRLMNKLKTKAQNTDVASKINNIKIEKFICSHDEKFPQPCVLKIIFEKRFA